MVTSPPPSDRASQHTNLPIARVATERPAAVDVFLDLELDFYADGERSLAECCQAAGLDPAAVLRSVRMAESQAPAPKRWDHAPTDELVDHLVDTFHTPLFRKLAWLGIELREARKMFPLAARAPLERLSARFERYRADTEVHLYREERVLFPWVLAGRHARALGPLLLAQEDHRHEAHAIAELGSLAEACGLPEESREGWTALRDELHAFRRTQQLHMHLENNILFSRAMTRG